MPNIKSAKKRVKVIETKTLRNQMIKSNLKTCIKKFEEYIANGDKDNAVALCSEVYKKIDKAVAKGIFHKNTAARKKSLIATRLNKMA
ncbi:MAG: 30S ribosomal protein S20 [Clostridia bacterium]|nr:30S ribosomal protein S20 [Clostridia bacterium]